GGRATRPHAPKRSHTARLRRAVAPKRNWPGALAALALIGALVMTAAAQDKTKVTLGTATPGGGFPVYGQAVTETIHDVDPTLEIEPRNTKGSTETVPLLEKGELDIALVQGEVAIESIGKLPILTAMYATAGMFVVRADSRYRTIDDLRGQPIA